MLFALVVCECVFMLIVNVNFIVLFIHSIAVYLYENSSHQLTAEEIPLKLLAMCSVDYSE